MSSQAERIPLTGLNALNPLAYLAALGCLSAATDECAKRGLDAPTLSFESNVRIGTYIRGHFGGEDGLLDLLESDLHCLAGLGSAPRDPFLNFEYESSPGKFSRDLKPPPIRFHSFARELIQSSGPDDRRSVDWASSVLTDVALDNKGACKPFALHFTAGNQQFLKVAKELLDGPARDAAQNLSRKVDRADLSEAVLGPWLDERALKVFCWSPTQGRSYALRSKNPSQENKPGTPGADWLALRGLTLLSSAPVKDRIETSGIHGGWKSGRFSFPIWESEVCAVSAQSLLRHPAVCSQESRESLRASERISLPRGVEILTCWISRTEQGGYGSFSNAVRG